MLRARELHEAGWKSGQIPAMLEREGLGRPAPNTVLRWVNPGYRMRQAQGAQQWNRQAGVSAATFLLSSRTPEYQLAFMQRLRREGIPCSSIAKVCRVVLGLNVSREYVRDQLRPTT
jgi:hypothetical protein